MYIIDIEGTDGSGKATQTKLLFEHLSSLGYNCKLLSFPNYDSPSSAPVKMYLSGELGDNNSVSAYQASVLYAVDRFITVRQSELEQFDIVIFDRFTYSNMIHQSTKFEREADMEKFLNWVDKFEFGMLELPRPDLTIFLDVPPEASFKLAHGRKTLKNGQTKDILEDDFSHIKKAYERAKHIADKFLWTTIDCSQDGKVRSIDDVHERVKQAVNSALKEVKL